MLTDRNKTMLPNKALSLAQKTIIDKRQLDRQKQYYSMIKNKLKVVDRASYNNKKLYKITMSAKQRHM